MAREIMSSICQAALGIVFNSYNSFRPMFVLLRRTQGVLSDIRCVFEYFTPLISVYHIPRSVTHKPVRYTSVHDRHEWCEINNETIAVPCAAFTANKSSSGHDLSPRHRRPPFACAELWAFSDVSRSRPR